MHVKRASFFTNEIARVILCIVFSVVRVKKHVLKNEKSGRTVPSISTNFERYVHTCVRMRVCDTRRARSVSGVETRLRQSAPLFALYSGGYQLKSRFTLRHGVQVGFIASIYP